MEQAQKVDCTFLDCQVKEKSLLKPHEPKQKAAVLRPRVFLVAAMVDPRLP